MDRRTSRQIELGAIVIVGLFWLLAVGLAVVSDSWSGIGLILIGGCVFAPLYLAWGGWFVVRGSQRSRPE